MSSSAGRRPRAERVEVPAPPKGVSYGLFRVFPKRGPSLAEQEIRVALAIQRLGIAERLPRHPECRVRIEGRVAKGTSVREAHGVWTATGLEDTTTPRGLMRQPLGARTSQPLWRVSIECVETPSGGMGSFYGFKGFFLSLLLALPRSGRPEVWDARGERAT